MISVIHLNWTNEAHRSELLKAPTHLFHDRTDVCVEDGGVFLCIRIYLFYGTMCVDEYKHTMTLFHDPP